MGGTLTDFFSTRPGVFALGVNYWDLPFNGMIDELKVYEASLSAAEIRRWTSITCRARAAGLRRRRCSISATSPPCARISDCRAPEPMRRAVSWQSSNPAVLSTRGKVTRPGRDQPDADVTLTATISLNGQSTAKTFAVTVKSLAPPVPVAAYRFEDNLMKPRGARARAVTGDRIFNAGGSVSYVDRRRGPRAGAERRERRAAARQPAARPQLFDLRCG